MNAALIEVLEDCARVFTKMRAGTLPQCFSPNDDFIARINAALAEAKRDDLRATFARLLNDGDCAAGADLGPDVARLYVKVADLEAARAAIAGDIQ